MNLRELKKAVDLAVERANEFDDNPKKIIVSIQVNLNKSSVFSSDVDLHYDGNLCASGCVIAGDSADRKPSLTEDCQQLSP